MALGFLPAFCCYFLVHKMYYLDCISSIHSLRDWNFYTPQRFFCSETSLKCIFLSISLCTTGLAHKNIICMKIRGKGQEYPRGKHSSFTYINLHKPFTVVCSFWLAQISPMGFTDVRVWLPGDLWATCYLWASLIPFILLEVERTKLQFPSSWLNFWGVNLGKTHTETGAQESPLSPLHTWPCFLRPPLSTHKMGVRTVPFSQEPFPCPISSPCKCYRTQIQVHLYTHLYKWTLISEMTNKH